MADGKELKEMKKRFKDLAQKHCYETNEHTETRSALKQNKKWLADTEALLIAEREKKAQVDVLLSDALERNATFAREALIEDDETDYDYEHYYLCLLKNTKKAKKLIDIVLRCEDIEPVLRSLLETVKEKLN